MSDNILEPSQNRLDYFEIMEPEEGYEIDKIIATTYSLDLNTLICLLVMLGLNIDEINMKNKIKILYELKKLGQKAIVFCQAGKINVPKQAEDLAIPSTLYALLENTIFPISLANKKAFHPKTFLIRYIKGTEVTYKYVVMSRNLTFSKNWDITVAMSGRLKRKEKEAENNKTVERIDSIVGNKRGEFYKNKPLIDFYSFLLKQWKVDKTERRKKESQKEDKTERVIQKKKEDLEKVLKEMEQVAFDLDTREIFNDFVFLPIGIGNDREKVKQEILHKKYVRSLIISPFISSNVVKTIYENGQNAERILITRISNELENLKTKKVDALKLYAMDKEIQETDIHAKLYLFERENGDIELYLGSANATNSGLGISPKKQNFDFELMNQSNEQLLENSNVEILMKFTAKKNKFNVAKLKQDLRLDEEKKAYFKRVELQELETPEPEESKKEWENILYTVMNLEGKGVAKKEEDQYSISIQFKNADLYNVQKEMFSNSVITLAPLTKQDKKIQLTELLLTSKNEIVFQDLEQVELTEFFVIALDDKEEAIIKIPVEGIEQEREDNIVNQFFKKETDILEYVLYMLGDITFLVDSQEETGQKKGKIGSALSSSYFNGIYERILEMLKEHPEKIKEIEELLTIIEKNSNKAEIGNVVEFLQKIKEAFEEVNSELTE